jgi:hypothetical protein
MFHAWDRLDPGALGWRDDRILRRLSLSSLKTRFTRGRFAELPHQRAGKLAFAHRPHLDENPAELPSAPPLNLKRLSELVFRDHTLGQQDLPDRVTPLLGGGSVAQ